LSIFVKIVCTKNGHVYIRKQNQTFAFNSKPAITKNAHPAKKPWSPVDACVRRGAAGGKMGYKRSGRSARSTRAARIETHSRGARREALGASGQMTMDALKEHCKQPRPLHWHFHFLLFPVYCVLILMAAIFFIGLDLLVFVARRVRGSARKISTKVIPLALMQCAC
jgi:hypothetical protein